MSVSSTLDTNVSCLLTDVSVQPGTKPPWETLGSLWRTQKGVVNNIDTAVRRDSHFLDVKLADCSSPAGQGVCRTYGLRVFVSAGRVCTSNRCQGSVFPG